jgi:hypothetical protein
MAEPSAPQTADAREQQRCAQRWIAELNAAEKAQRHWLDRSKKIIRLYKRQDATPDDEARKRFAMLWTNTETLKPAVYARPPEPVVSRRFDDADPVARVASEILERTLSASIDLQDLDGALRACRDDYVLIGRGQTWERYVPTHGPEVTPEIELQVVTEGTDEDPDAPKTYTDADGAPYEGEVQTRDDGSVYHRLRQLGGLRPPPSPGPGTR